MTREDILEAAAQVFRQKGFHGASMQDIAEAVNLQKASLYHHVSSKQEILLALLDRAAHNRRAQVEILESLEVFPSTLPTRRDSAYSGWVSISVGCNNTCTFCIVPSLRGKERDRRCKLPSARGMLD